MNILQILDYVTSILIVISIFLVEKHRKAWLLYSFSSVLFVIECVAKSLPGLSVMGCILTIVGLRNYSLREKSCTKKRGQSLRTKPRDRFEQWLDLHNHKCELVRTVGSVLSGIGGTLAILRLLGII